MNAAVARWAHGLRPATLLATALAVAAVTVAGCAPPPLPYAPESHAAITELERTDVVTGAGEGISQDQVAVVHYTGWVYDADAADRRGKQFDSSRTRGKPFRFTVGGGEVIKGWDEGVQGMQVGGQRELLVPAAMGYGSSGAGGVIPPGAALLFEVELLAIEQP